MENQDLSGVVRRGSFGEINIGSADDVEGGLRLTPIPGNNIKVSMVFRDGDS